MKEPITRKDVETVAAYLAAVTAIAAAMWWFGPGAVLGWILAPILLVTLIGIPIQIVVSALSGNR